MQPTENLYEQKPEEVAPVIPAASSVTNGGSKSSGGSSSFSSRFEYNDDSQSQGQSVGGTQVLNHVAPPKSSSFFSDFGMDSSFPKKPSSNSSKARVKQPFVLTSQKELISKNRFLIKKTLFLLVAVRLKNRMKQGRSSQTQSPFLQLSTLVIRTRTLILNQKLLFRSFQ